MLKKSFLLAVVLIFSLSAQVLAEEIVLKSGEKLEGKVLEKTDKYIKVDPGIGMVMTYYAEDIDTIDGQKFQITPASSPVVDAPPVNQSSDQTTAENTNNSEVGDLSQAEDSIKNGDYGTAEIILNKLINNGSNNFSVYADRALCYWNLKDYDDANSDYFKAIKIDPEQGKKLFKMIAFVYLKKGNGAQADSWLRQYLEYFPNDPESYYGLAVANYDSRFYEGALANLNTAEGLGYTDSEGLRLRIQSAQAAERSRQVAQSYNSTQTYHSSSSSSSSKDIGYAFYGLGFGIYSFFHGLICYRKKRAIESIPTSTVRGLAMGLVELNGKAKATKLIVAPLTANECAFYRYTVERYESSGRSGQWVLISSGDSDIIPFTLEDDTGKIMVLPKGAEFVMPVDYEFSTRFGEIIPDNIVRFMASIEHGGMGGSLRFREWHIKPDESVFVLGTAKKFLIKNEAYMPLSLESEAIVAESPSAQEAIDVMIAKGDNRDIFIVSDESQTQVVKGFSWQAITGVWGGAALTLAMLAYLLFRFGLWSRF